MLRQAFLNLALNACQAMPDGGTLRIALRVGRAAGRAKITVADTGVGIKPEHLQRIFDLYFTTKEGQRHRLVDGVPHCSDARRRD